MSIGYVNVAPLIPDLFKPIKEKETFTEKGMALFEKRLGPTNDSISFFDWNIWRSLARIVVYSSLSLASFIEDGLTGTSQARFRALAIEIISASFAFSKKLDIHPEWMLVFRHAAKIAKDNGIAEGSDEGKAILNAVTIKSLQHEPDLLENLYPNRLYQSTALESLFPNTHKVLFDHLNKLWPNGENRIVLSRDTWTQKREGPFPAEIWMNVFENYSVAELLRAMRTSKTFYLLGSLAIQRKLKHQVHDPALQELIKRQPLSEIGLGSNLTPAMKADLFLIFVDLGITWEKAKKVGWSQMILQTLCRPAPGAYLDPLQLKYERDLNTSYMIEMMRLLVERGFDWEKIIRTGWKGPVEQIFSYIGFVRRLYANSPSEIATLFWIYANLIKGDIVTRFFSQKDRYAMLSTFISATRAADLKAHTFSAEDILKIVESLDVLRLIYPEDRCSVSFLIDQLLERSTVIQDQFSEEQKAELIAHCRSLEVPPENLRH